MNAELVESKDTSKGLIEDYRSEVDLKNQAYEFILEKKLFNEFKEWVESR